MTRGIRLAALLLASPAAAQQDVTLDQAVWSFPALRSLRNTIVADSLLAPALERCRSAALARQRLAVALLRSRADSASPAAADSLRRLATAHEGIPVSQLDAGCLLTSADSLPGLISRRGSLPRLEELVGLLRSGRVTPERKEELRSILAGAGERAGTLDESALRREIAQQSVRDFLDAYAAREAALRPPPPPPKDSTRGPVPLSLKIPERPPTKAPGKKYRVTFTVESSGEVSAISIAPEITDSADWRSMIESLKQYRFKPALDSLGRPIRGTYPFDFVIGPPPRKP